MTQPPHQPNPGDMNQPSPGNMNQPSPGNMNQPSPGNMNQPSPGNMNQPGGQPPKSGLPAGAIAAIVALVAIIIGLIIFIVVISSGSDENAELSPSSGETAVEGSVNADENASGSDAQAPADGTAEVPSEGDSPVSSEEGAEPTAEATDVDPRVIDAIEEQWRLEEGDPMARGDLDAKLVFQVYSDYQCGYCHDFNVETLPQLQPLIDDGTIRVEYHELPVLGPNSELAAQASHAAAQQDKFWEFHDEMYAAWGESGGPEITEDYLKSVAEKAGVEDLDKFTTDMHSDEIIGKVQKDLQHSTQYLGISGTPAFIIGYSYIPGNIPMDQIESVIDHELTRTDIAK